MAADSPELLSFRSRALEIDAICDRFERDWKSGTASPVETYLTGIAVDSQADLFEELLALDVAYRRARGETVATQEYVSRFPDRSDAIVRVLDPVQAEVDTQAMAATHPESGRGSRIRQVHAPQLGPFGPYDLLEEIGRGGMGIVYKARQRALDRIVAIKTILSGASTPPAIVERFRTEARLAAKLQHPGIVPIYEVGEFEGHHFFSMEYVEGETLAKEIERGPMEPVRVATLAKSVAEIVEFAHRRGVLHRDLKPSNLVVDDSGRLRVMDFGLARQIDGSSSLTLEGQALGTPSFMAPEQARGDSSRVDRRSDVYGLGATLYAMLSGEPPFRADSAMSTMAAVLRDPVRPLRELRPQVDRDLESICLKCLAKDPEARYASMKEVAADLDRYLARPAAKTAMSGAGSKRRTGWLVALAGAAGAAVLAIAIWIIVRDRDGNEIGRYKLPDGGGVEMREIDGDAPEKRTSSASQPVPAKDAIPAPTTASAPVALAPLAPPPQARVFAPGEPLGLGALVKAPRAIEGVGSWTVETLVPRDSVTSIDFHPQGDRLATASRDGTVRIWDAKSMKPLRAVVTADHNLVLARYWRGGEVLLTASAIGVVEARDEQGRSLGAHATTPTWPTCLAGSPNGTLVAMANVAGIYVIDFGVANEVVTHVPLEETTALAWSRDGKSFAAAGKDNRIRLYEATSGIVLREWSGHAGTILNLVWSDDGSRLFSAGGDHAVRVWSIDRDPAMAELVDFTRNVVQVVFPQPGRFLAAYDDGQAQLREIDGGRILREFGGASTPGSGGYARWSADGEREVRVASGGRLVSRKPATGEEQVTAGLWNYCASPTWNYPMPPVAWSSRGTIAYGTPSPFDGPSAIPALWNLDAERLVTPATGSKLFHVVSAGWSSDGSLLATGGSEPETKIWDAEGKHLVSLPTGGWVMSAVFQPGTNLLAVALQGGDVQFWEATTGERKRSFQIHKSSAFAAWSPDGTRMASSSFDGSLKIWNAETGEILADVTQPEEGQNFGQLFGIDWSGDGKSIACSGDSAAYLIDAESGAIRHILRGAGGWTYATRFSPDSKTLAAASGDGIVRFWNVETGDLKKSLQNPGPVRSVAWSSDGTRILASGDYPNPNVWDAESGTLETSLVPLGLDAGLTMTPRGDVTVSPADEAKLVYVLQTPEGQLNLSPAEFRERYPYLASPPSAADDARLGPLPIRDFAPREPLGNAALVARPRSLDGVDSWTVETLAPRSQPVAVDFDPKGELLSVASRDGTARIFDVRTQRCVRAIVTSDSHLLQARFWRDGRRLLTANDGSNVSLWDLKGRLLASRSIPWGTITNLTGSPRGSLVACVRLDSVLLLDFAAEGSDSRRIDVEQASALAWTPDGTKIAVADKAARIRLFDATTGAAIYEWEGHSDRVSDLVWSEDGSRLYSAGMDSAIRVWSPESERPVAEFVDLPGRVSQVLLPGPGQVLAAFDGGGGRLFSIAEGKTLQDYADPKWSVDAGSFMRWAANGKIQSRAYVDGSLALRDPRTHVDARVEGFGTQFVTSPSSNERQPVAWSSRGTIAYGTPQPHESSRSTLTYWNLDAEPKAVPVRRPGQLDVGCAAWSSDGSLLATGGQTPEIDIWNAEGKLLRSLPTGHWGTSVAFRPGTKELAIGMLGEEVQIWDAESGERKRTFPTQMGITFVVWSPDGARIASASRAGQFKVWSAATGEIAFQLPTLDPSREAVEIFDVDWSSDGRTIACAGDYVPYLVDAESGAIRRSLTRAPLRIHATRFSPDSKTLAVASYDGQIRLWHVDSGELMHELQNSEGIRSLAWSPDGKSIVVSGTLPNPTIWDAESGELKRSLVPLGQESGFVVAPDGDVETSDEIEAKLVYVLQTPEGQLNLSPAEFRERYQATAEGP